MPQMVVTVNADERESVWHIDASNGQNAAQLWPTRNLTIEWADGTTALLPKRLPFLTNPGFATTVDITTLDYYVVTYKGSTDPANIVPVSALGTLDTLFSGKDWGLLRVFGRWGSRDPLVGGGSGSGLPEPELRGSLLYVPLDGSPAEWLQPAKGDIVRGNQDGTGPYWERYALGAPTSVLYSDPVTGLPIWLSLDDLGVLLGPVLAPILGLDTIVIGSSTAAKALSLWTGSGNASFPPAWFAPAPTYDDSGWGHAVLAFVNPLFPAPAGTVPIWSTFQPVSHTEICIFRQVVSIPNRPITAATLTMDELGTPILFCYINGNLIASHTYPDGSGVTATIPSWMLPSGSDVLIAFACQNFDLSGSPVGGATGEFQLTLTLG